MGVRWEKDVPENRKVKPWQGLKGRLWLLALTLILCRQVCNHTSYLSFLDPPKTTIHTIYISPSAEGEPQKKHNTTFSNLAQCNAVNYFHLSECALPRGPFLAPQSGALRYSSHSHPYTSIHSKL